MVVPRDSQLEDWIAYVSALPYFERRLEIVRRVRPPQSRHLYKYRAINPDSEESIQWTRDILVKSRLWLSSPLDFNDPFDTSARLVAKGTAKQLRARSERILQSQGMNRKERRSRSKAIAKIPLQRFEDHLSRSFEENLRTWGVYCFAGDPRSILMWSHYAYNHQGICIQFERAKDYETLSNAVRVNYCSDYPTVDWVKDFEEGLGKVILRKFEDWKYEREERLTKPEYAQQYIFFKPEAITAIIYGCRVTDRIRDEVEGLLAERRRRGAPDVTKYCAYMANTTYSLCMRREIDR